MPNRENQDLKTSRRSFTKIATTALVALPALVSWSCKKTPPPPPDNGPPTTPTTDVCFSSGGVEEHIPPMGVTDGGSLILETTGEIEKKSNYYEQKNPADEDRLGDITKVTVITETATKPYLTVNRYYVLPPNSQLLLWYQRLKQNPGNDECDFEPIKFDEVPPDVTIQGGNKAAGRPLRMSFPEDLKPKEKTHKCKRPHKYTQPDKSGSQGHFRIGQWRLVDGNKQVIKDVFGKPFEDSVNKPTIPEHFSIYIDFDHYDPNSKKSSE